MTTVAAYRRALERLYTLIGREYSIVVVCVNQQWSGSAAAARELVLVARSISSEGSPVTGIRQIIRGPVLRVDLNSDEILGSRPNPERGVNDIVNLRVADIQAALGGRSFPPNTPMMIALVGVGSDTVSRFSDYNCIEREDLVSVATGGYLVLSYASADDSPLRLSWTELCTLTKKTTRPAACLMRSEPHFLVGDEKIDDKRKFTYAIRLQPEITKSGPVIQPVEPEAPSKRLSKIEQLPAIMKSKTESRVIRAPRWRPVAVQPELLGWEHLVQSTVERELSKMLTVKSGREEQTVQQLGDGLLARVWPDLIHKISMDKDWTAVFTHQSSNPTPRSNYESFETLGDKILNVCLVHYLFSNGKTIDSNGFTDSVKEILSRPRQSAMAISMGLNEKGLIKSDVSVGREILEDIYEAFFGCLFTVANRLVDGGNQGLPLCELLFRRVLHEVYPDLDPWSVPKDPQTTLDQIFIRLEWGHPIISYDDETRVTTIRLTRDAQNFLSSMGPGFNRDKPLAIGPREEDKQSSARAASEIALATLKNNWGITTRYASMVVRSRLMRDERYASVQREALKIAESMGYTDIYVARRAKNHNQLYAVMGVSPDDSETQLHIYKYETGKNLGGGEDMSTRVAAYITALREFMATKKPVVLP